MSAQPGAIHQRPIIDMTGVVLDEACWEAYLLDFARNVPDYVRVFGPAMAQRAGIDTREFRAALATSPEKAVHLLIDSGTFVLDLDAHVAELKREGVERQVMLGGVGVLRDGGTFNQRVAEFAHRHPDRLEAWAGLDLSDPEAALKELRECVFGFGMRGVGLSHFITGCDPLSPASHSIYEEAAKLGLPFWIHTGHNLSSTRPIDFCTWRHIDAIACAHPSLIVIAGHGGWPWVSETIAVCQRHPNVYLDISTHRASRMPAPGSGWAPLLLHGRGTIRRKVVFGSVTWAHGMSVRSLTDEIEALDIDERSKQMWLHDNGAAILEQARRMAPTLAKT